MDTYRNPSFIASTSVGGQESVMGNRFLLLVVCGILARPGWTKVSDPRQDFLSALSLADRGRTTEAIASYRILLERHPDLSEGWNNLAALEAARGDLDAARQALRKALECRQATQVALRNLDRVVGRLARQAYESALATPDSAQPGPRLELVRTLVAAVDTTRGLREADSLRRASARLARQRDSLERLQLAQGAVLDSTLKELATGKTLLERIREREARAQKGQDALTAANGLLQRRSDSLQRIVAHRDGEGTRLRGLLQERSREADSLRRILARREAEGDSLRRTLARVEEERLQARREAERRTSEAARLRADQDGRRVASVGSGDMLTGTASGSPLVMLENWADAWSRRDVDTYLSFYSEAFLPAEGRETWEAKRRERLGIADSIRIVIQDPRIRTLPSGDAEVVFRQLYTAGDTRLATRKRVLLRREVPGWKIHAEEAGIR